MLTPNNPQIDTAALARKIDRMDAARATLPPVSSVEPAAVSLAQEPAAEFLELADLLAPNAAPVDAMPVIAPVSPSTSPTMTEAPTTMPASEKLSVPGRALNWIKNILRLNARLFSLHARQDRLQQELDALRVHHQRELEAVQSRHEEAWQAARREAQQSLEAAQRALQELHQVVDQLAAVSATTDRRLAQFDHANIANRLNRLDALDISNRLNAFDTINIANRLAQIESDVTGIAEGNRERDVRVALMQQAAHGAARTSSSAMPLAATAAPVSNPDIDRFYLEFESKFRGEPGDIRERLKVYLPHVQHLIGAPGVQAVDVGCGRGEWLELMRDSGVPALGIDMNLAMVEMCRARGLQAECTDAIAWLRRQAPGSLAMVTGFHLIEHLPFATLLELFDAALQALRPDGLLIVETPNPENLVVGACHFYYDPTHRNPIVPAVAEFIARQRGFVATEILRFNAYPDNYLLPDDSEIARRFNRAFYGPQDFALIARKPHAD